MKRWEDVELVVTSPPIPLWKYATPQLDTDTVISIMVGDLQRLRLYATSKRPFQITQVVPEDVWWANELLIRAGYTWNLVKDEPHLLDHSNSLRGSDEAR